MTEVRTCGWRISIRSDDGENLDIPDGNIEGDKLFERWTDLKLSLPKVRDNKLAYELIEGEIQQTLNKIGDLAEQCRKAEHGQVRGE